MDYVCQIVTFSEYNLKNLIKAYMRIKNPDDYARINNMTKIIPGLVAGQTTTYALLMEVYSNPDKFEDVSAKAYNEIKTAVEELEKLFVEYPDLYKVIIRLKGCIEGSGLHAGGVVISSKKLTSNLPVMTGSDTAVLPVCQLNMDDLHFFSALKIDVLGLTNLTQVKDCMDLVGLGWDWFDNEDFGDPNVYEMLRKGMTTNVFQMAGQGATRMIKDMHVDDFEGLGVVNAGNRPGPISKNKDTGKSMVDDYTERIKTGKIPSIDKRIDWILEDAKGCIWYQEHCQRLGQVMAGYSLGMADARIRGILAKKKVKKIPELRNEFIYGKESLYDNDGNVIGRSEVNSSRCIGAVNNGFSEELAIRIFDIMESFAKYSFNKAHSSAYAALAYKTAYLACYYPAEWAVACMMSFNDKEKISLTLTQAKKSGVNVLGPDINKSENTFSIELDDENKKNIRYGLSAITNVGTAAVKYIIDIRDDSGDFTNFKDFYNRVHDKNNINKFSNKFNKKGVAMCPIDKRNETNLINAGAFDSLEKNRFKLMNLYMMDLRKEKNYEPLDHKSYMRRDKLRLELECMGSYVSEHPLEPFPYVDLSEATNGEEVTITGMVTKVKKQKTKTGKPFGKVYLEAKDGKEFLVMCFGKVYENNKDKFKKNEILVVKGNWNLQWSNINASHIKKIIKKSQVMRRDTDDDGIEDYTNKEIEQQVLTMPVRDI